MPGICFRPYCLLPFHSRPSLHPPPLPPMLAHKSATKTERALPRSKRRTSSPRWTASAVSGTMPVPTPCAGLKSKNRPWFFRARRPRPRYTPALTGDAQCETSALTLIAVTGRARFPRALPLLQHGGVLKARRISATGAVCQAGFRR